MDTKNSNEGIKVNKKRKFKIYENSPHYEEKIYHSIIIKLDNIKDNNNLLRNIQSYINHLLIPEETNEIEMILNDIRNYININDQNYIKGRRLPFPERISETIAKICLIRAGENVFKGESGDLTTSSGYKFEVKCFSSVGHISFGPTCSWNELIFVDLLDYVNYNVKVYRTRLSNNCPQWNSINISKIQSFEEQKEMKRRPRICFTLLYPQIKDYTTLLYEGPIQNLINK
jgi:hypothetical protein